MRNIITILFSALLLVGCNTIKVSTDYDPSVDFSQFKTYEYYGWAKESDKIMTRLDKERFEKAFGEEFAARGLKYVENGGDLIVTLFIVVEQKTDLSTSTTRSGGYGAYGGYYGGYYGYGPGYGWGPSYSQTTVKQVDYEVGTLVCDVYDAKNKKLIWEGIGSKTLKEGSSSNRERAIKIAVNRIMATYPL